VSLPQSRGGGNLMPDDGYKYDVGQCDVPKERRPALSRFRQKRREWVSWLDTDEHHAIWRTLDTMVWTDVAFNALKTFAKDNDENALNNPLIVEALVRGHMATQSLAIRRLMEKTHDKERLSVPRLVNDLKRHRKLFTQENYVCYDGLPYDYQAVRDAVFSKIAARKENTVFVGSGATEGPEAYGASEAMHQHFDKLSGVDAAARTREDRLPLCLLETIEAWLKNSGADVLEKWSGTYLAHAGGPTERARLDGMAVTFGKVTDTIKSLARVVQAISLFVYGGGRAGAVMPVAQFDPFMRLDKPIMHPGDDDEGYARWRQLSADWDRCLDSVEDELVGRV
jgi:hypothetical protein